MPLDVLSSKERPEGLFGSLQEFSSPFFTFDQDGVQLWNFGKEKVRKKLEILGLSQLSENEFVDLFSLNKQEILDLMLGQETPLASTLDCVLDTRHANLQMIHLDPRSDKFFHDYKNWQREFIHQPEKIKWFSLRFGQNLGYVFNPLPTTFSHSHDSTLKIFRRQEDYLESSLKLLEQKDEYTIGHMQRVAEFSLRLFTKLIEKKEQGELSSEILTLFPYSRADNVNFKQAAFLHDIGKIHIPDSILLRDTRINQQNMAYIQKSMVALLNTQLITLIQSGDCSDQEILGILDDNKSKVREVMKVLDSINSKHKLEKTDYSYLETFGRQGFFQDKEDEQSAEILQTCFDRLHIPYGNLLPWERETIESHSILSWKILNQLGNPFPGTALHHKNFNFNGYPSRCELLELLLIRDIHFPSAQDYFIGLMIQIADAFDAICTSRPYDQARSPYQAIRIFLEESGKQFHPEVVKCFIEVLLEDEKKGFAFVEETFQIGNAKTLSREEW
jgi:HD-GYP domain-containing protein (c-di-GMP phosphodiesterase class II)